MVSTVENSQIKLIFFRDLPLPLSFLKFPITTKKKLGKFSVFGERENLNNYDYGSRDKREIFSC